MGPFPFPTSELWGHDGRAPLLCPQDAYDLSQLRDPDLFRPPTPRGKPLRRRDAPHSYALPQHLHRCPSDIEDFINEVKSGEEAGREGARRAKGTPAQPSLNLPCDWLC